MSSIVKKSYLWYKKKVYNTRTSQVVTHPSTTQARRCLTLEIRRDPVVSPWYGRRQLGKFTRKRGVSILAKFFEKENIPIFFRELLKNCGKTSWKGSETIRKNYLVVFKIWATKKKLTDHPSHPSIQALSRLVRSGWYPVAYMTRLEQSTCKTSHSMCKTRYSTCKTRQSKIFSKGKRKVFVNFIKEIPYKFVRPNF